MHTNSQLFIAHHLCNYWPAHLQVISSAEFEFSVQFISRVCVLQTLASLVVIQQVYMK